MKKELKNMKGITLIALVITIVVLLILAGVSIAMLTGDNGILTQANKSKVENEKATAKEKVEMEVAGSRGTDGKIDYNLLNDNLRKNVKGLIYGEGEISEDNSNRITSLPAVVNVDGYVITIEESGKVSVEQVNNNIVEPKNIEDWEWKEEADGTITITMYKGKDTEVIIPNHINGIPVKKISGEPLSNYPSITTLWSEDICELVASTYKLDQTTINKVIISEGIESIDEEAFAHSIALVTVTIPSSIINIGDRAFQHCSNLEFINYTGTEEEWDNISKEYSFINDTNPTINYNYKY